MVILKKNITKVFIFANVFLLLNLSPTLSECLRNNCSFEKKYKYKESKLKKFNEMRGKTKANLLELNINNINNTFLEKILIADDVRIDYFIDVLIANNNPKVENKLAIDIESDKQYQENDIYYAEGNVIITLKNGILKADKFSYDKTNRRVKITNNISFKKGNQYFKASSIDYNFATEKGEVINISGFLSLNNLEKDLNLYQNNTNFCLNENLDLLDLPSELELLNTKNTRLDNIYGLTSDFGSISNWRFKSDKILVKKNLWQSEYIEFTNDPFEKPQFIVESNNFNAEIINNTYKFKSKSTSLNFENKLRIPIGNRTISDRDLSSNWGLGYDYKSWDGLYIYRNSNIIELTRDLDFSFKSYFLVQRAIRGRTNAFRLEDASFVEDKVLQNTAFSDYIGLEADIKGAIFNMDSNINLKLGSLNEQRINDSLSVDANITKTLFSNSNRNSNNQCPFSERLPNNRFSVKSGFYGAFLKDNIYSAYGTKLITEYSIDRKNIKDDFSLIFDVGSYKGKALKSTQFLSLDRYGINATFKNRYRLLNLNDDNIVYDKTFNKTPNIIDNSIFLNTKISTSVYQYSNEESQRVFLAGIGPSFTLGTLKNDFLDFSYFSIMPEFIHKKGQSPFNFDDFNSDSRIKFTFKQQIYGPLLFGLSSDLIINTKSEKYGEFQNIQYSLDFSRRAYNIYFYFKNDQSFGLNFNIFNFDSKFW